MSKLRLTAVVTAFTLAVSTLIAPIAANAAPGPKDPTQRQRAEYRANMSGGFSAFSSGRASETGTVDWRTCAASAGLVGLRAQCAFVSMPMDHTNPGGERIQLAVSRIKHTSSKSKYQGVMLVNPGGPGVSGLDFAAISTLLPPKLAGRYDWIGFDPRGVGASQPRVTCDSKFIGFNRPNYYPKPQANEDVWLTRTQNYAASCATNNGNILKFMTTADSAHDMEALRVALGVSQINYYGFSYGTYLGQIYSTLFPNRIARQIFDSNVDPQKVFYQLNLDQDVAFQGNLNRWFRWIARNADTWRLGKTGKAVKQRFVRVQARLAKNPAGGKLGPNEWIDTFLSAGYNQSSWKALAESFAQFVRTDNPRPLIRSFREEQNLGDDNGFAVYNAVQCTDAQWPLDWAKWERDNDATYKKAPLTTWMNAWFNAPCLYWPVAGMPAVVVDGSKAPATLLIGETLDGATPFPGNRTVRRLFPKSSLVAVMGGLNHANSPNGNPCVYRAVQRYLRDGTLPKRKPGTAIDLRCKKQRFLG